MSTMSDQKVLDAIVLMHFGRLTEAPVADVQVPQVDAQVVRGEISLAIRVDGNTVDVVGVGILIDLPRNSRHDIVLWCHQR